MVPVSAFEALAARKVERRNLLQRLGASVASAAVLSAASTAGLVASTKRASAQVTDAAIFNFALNLEYLEAEYYLRAVTGSGIPSSLTSGTGSQGTVTGGSAVPFQNSAIAYFAQRIANDELAHVTFLREALGSAAVAEPTINLSSSWTTLASAAGLLGSGQTFDPFSSELDFLLGAFVFEDVGCTAYAGAAALLTVPADISYAASVLAIEGYHAGGIRERLSDLGGGAATDAIASLRQALSGVLDLGTSANGNPANVSDDDYNGQCSRRTPGEVLAIVFAGGVNGGLFFPNGVNGTLNTATPATA